jgi:membrane protease YdiL (CAAX protease family)
VSDAPAAEPRGTLFLAGLAVLAYALFAAAMLAANKLGAPPPVTIAASAVATLAFWLPWRVVAPLRPAGALSRAALAYPPFLLVWIPLGLVVYPYALRLLDQPFPPQPMLDQLARGEHAGADLWALILAIVVLGPLAEEIVFRGFVQAALRSAAGPQVAIVVSAVLFGAIHGAAYALPIALLGLLFGWLRERHGGLAAPILAHMLHNGLTVAVTITLPQTLDWIYRR